MSGETSKQKPARRYEGATYGDAGRIDPKTGEFVERKTGHLRIICSCGCGAQTHTPIDLDELERLAENALKMVEMARSAANGPSVPDTKH